MAEVEICCLRRTRAQVFGEVRISTKWSAFGVEVRCCGNRLVNAAGLGGAGLVTSVVRGVGVRGDLGSSRLWRCERGGIFIWQYLGSQGHMRDCTWIILHGFRTRAKPFS